MATSKVTFYFAFNSPYAFLGNTRIEKELAPFSVQLECKPIYSPRSGGGGPDFDSPKLKYMFKDIARFADAYGLKLQPGPFADTGDACRGFFFAQKKGCGRAYIDAVYSARWLEGKDIGDVSVLTEVAEKCGLDREAYLAALKDPANEAALQQSNKDGEADEVFGFPTFMYEGEKFWGNDRIEWLVREIRARSS